MNVGFASRTDPSSLASRTIHYAMPPSPHHCPEIHNSHAPPLAIRLQHANRKLRQLT